MRKTIITIMLTLLFVFPVCSFADSVRVGLKYGSSAASSYTLSSGSGFYIGTLDEGEFEPSLPVSAYTALNAVCENGSVNLYGDDGNVVLQDFERYVITAMDYDEGGVIKADGKEYRGGISVSVNSTGTINLINVLDVDDYVRGVLNGEMHHDHPEEALKAQAVAARSFALVNLNRHSQYGFDLCTTTHCQVYKGYADEYKETNAAVDDTAGLCIYSGGKVVSAYYFKNSGGYTQDSKDVWGGSSAYLKAVKDEYSPEYKWNATFTFSELKSKLGSVASGIGDITRIEIASRNESGAVDTLKFVGTSGNATVSKEQIRTLLGATAVKSTHFSFAGSSTGESSGSSGNSGGNGNGGQASPGGSGKSVAQRISLSPVKVMGSDESKASISSKTSVSVMGADGRPVSRTLKNVYAVDASAVSAVSGGGNTGTSNDSNTNTNNDGSSDSKTVEYVTESPVTFTGLGYGHGIGMPQDSAIEMAKQGFTYDEILQYYYTGIEIK